MTHTFTKKGLRGFTLIELLVVIAIIGLLATVIAAPITEARKKGRDAKKIADIRSIVTAIGIYADDNGGSYPKSIEDMVPRYLPTFPSGAATSTIGRDKYMYTAYVDSGAGNKAIGYHIGVKLESGNQALGDDADCGGIQGTVVASAPKTCIGDPTSNALNQSCSGATACTALSNNFGSGDAGGGRASNAADFGSVADTGTTTCTSALTTCVYDLSN